MEILGGIAAFVIGWWLVSVIIKVSNKIDDGFK